MSIWSQQITIKQLNSYNKDTIQEVLDIRFTKIGDDFLQGTMPINKRVHQPYGLLHGGASATLAETLGSMGAHLCIDVNKKQAVGTDLETHHLRPKRKGQLDGIARPLHLGRTSHLWDIKIYDERDKLINVSQLKMAIIENRKPEN